MQVIHRKQTTTGSQSRQGDGCGRGSQCSARQSQSVRRARLHKPNMGISPHHILFWVLLLLGLPSLVLVGAAQHEYKRAAALTEGGIMTLAVQDNLVLTMELSEDNLILPITPTANGQFGRADMTVKVTTNNTTGYSLTMQSNTTELTRRGKVNDTVYKIDPIGSSATCAEETETQCEEFPDNEWGYRVAGSNTYLPMSTSLTPLNSNNAFSGEAQETTIYFGVKLNNEKPTGIYDGVTLSFVATTNPIPPTIDDVLYMQDFALLNSNERTEMIKSMESEKQYVLKDARDGKDYYVSKLKDGQVWMTQNLDFDITAETVPYLTSQYTNLTTTGGIYGTDATGGYSQDLDGVITWKPAASAYTIMTGRDKTGTSGEINYGTNTGKWANNDSTPYTVDIGKWYQTGTYFASSVCNDVSWSVGCNVLNSGLVNANNNASTPLANYFKNNSTFETNGEHGAIGNYYNWNAAVASNATSSVSSGTYANSICPAGWGLPANGEYGVLNSTYNAGSTTNDKATANGLMGAPLYLVRGGVVYTNTTTSLSTAYEIGRYGRYWSSTASGAAAGYRLYFSSSVVSPASSYNRGRGLSVRCRAL